MPQDGEELRVCIPGTDFRLYKSSSQLGPWISRILLCLEGCGPLGGEQERLLGQPPPVFVISCLQPSLSEYCGCGCFE